MKNILIVEDDAVLASTLRESLRSTQTTVYVAPTLTRMRALLRKHRMDLCVLDRMVSGEDAIEEVEFIQDASPHIKILFLSRKSEVRERIRGLEAGADDYLCKPFSLAEFRLRARILLRRVIKWEGTDMAVSLGDLVFLPNEQSIQTPEGRITLQKREAEIILCLSQTPGVLVRKERMGAFLWPDSYRPHPDTLDVYIRRLRQKLGKYHSILQTHRGLGYRLVMHR